MAFAVVANFLGWDISGVGHGLGDGVVLGQELQFSLPEEVSSRVAQMDDEQVDAHAICDRERRTHAEQAVIVFTAPGERFVDRLDVIPDSLEELACFFLVDFEAPLGRVIDELHGGGDGEPAAATSPAAIPHHSVGDEHRVTGSSP